MCEQITGRPIPAVEKPRRPGDPLRLVASAEMARTELGWIPKLPKLEAIVSTAWNWHPAHPDGYGDEDDAARSTFASSDLNKMGEHQSGH